MSHVAIVTDSASDLPPDVARAAGITVVPLVVSFGAETFRPDVDLTTDEFWAADDRARRAVPDDRRRRRRATSSRRSDGAFERGADVVVCVDVSGDLSGTLKSAQVARGPAPRARDPRHRLADGLDGRTGCSPRSAPSSPPRASRAAEIARVLEERKADVDLFVALDTLEYLKRGGRISGARAAVGTMLSIKPIITVENGIVENADRVRSRPKARERTLELLTAKPLERAAILHTHERRRRGVPGRVPRALGAGPVACPDDARRPVGRPHLGPGCVGAWSSITR